MDDHNRMMERLAAMRTGMAARGGAHRERFAALASKIENGDDSDRYAALSELCEAINMATEDVINGMRAELLVPPIVSCLRYEHNPELMYLAARVLTYMCDALTPTSSCIVRCDGVPLLCERLMIISDIEFAEQCITCLDKIAAEHPGPVLEAGGAMSLLSFIDFFNVAVQRRAVSTVAQIVRRVNHRNFQLVQGVLPRLRQFLQSDDVKVAEHAIIALGRIANGVKSDAAASVEVFGETAPLLLEILDRSRLGGAGGQTSATPVFSAAIKFLADATQSAPVVEMLVEIGVPATLAEILATGGVSMPSPAAGGGASVLGMTPQGAAGDAASPLGVLATPPRAGRAAAPAPLDNTGDVMDPAPVMPSPLSTPQNAKGVTAVPKLTPDAVADIAAVLKNLLPPPQHDFLLYMEGLSVVLYEAPRAARRSPSDDDDGAEEHEEAEDDDDDDNTNEDEAAADRRRLHQRSASTRTAAMLDPRHRAGLARLLQSQGVRLEPDQRWARCRPNTHKCDSCSKANLGLGDWYRSNDQEDFDLCQRCLLVAVTTGSTSDAFTDMATVVVPAAGSGADATSAPASGPPQRQATPNEKTALLERSPYLLERIADALAVAIDVALDTDHPAAKRNCTEYVLRLVAQAGGEPEKHRHVFDRLLAIPAAGAFISALLRRSPTHTLGEVAAGVYIAAQCVLHVPTDALAIFSREGVLHALAALKSLPNSLRGASRPASPTTGGAPAMPGAAPSPELHIATSTDAGWRTLLATKASAILDMVADKQDSASVAALREATAAIEKFQWVAAAIHLQAALNGGGASSFELLSSGFLDHLVSAMQELTRTAPQAAVADFARFLAVLVATTNDGSASPRSSDAASLSASASGAAVGSAGSSTTALHKLVRHCHALVGQLECFGSGKSRPQQPIRLVIAAEPAAAPSEPSSPTTTAGAPHVPPAPAETTQRRSSRRSSDKAGSNSSSGHQARAARAAAAAPTTVSIEPLATIGAVADFIASRLLNLNPGSLPAAASRARNAEQGAVDGEDDDVEEILPPTEAEGGKPRRPAPKPATGDPAGGAATNSASTIFIRYGKQTLPHSMSMLQVMQQYVPRSAHGDPVHLYFAHNAAFVGDVAPVPSSQSQAHLLSPQFDGTILFRVASELREAFLGKMRVDTNADDEVPTVPGGGAATSSAGAALAECVPQSLLGILRMFRGIAAIVNNLDSVMDCVDVELATAGGANGCAVENDVMASLWGLQALAGGKELVNSKLTNKVLRFIDGPGCIPQLLESWCVALAIDCPCVFPTATRKLLFEVGFFGTSRALARVLEHSKEMERPITSHHRNHRVAKKRVRVSRDRALDCAKVLMAQHGLTRSWMEVQYYGEVGTGLGPTHEYFTLVGGQLRRPASLPGMWRMGDDTDDTSDAPIETTYGLFLRTTPQNAEPSPLPAAAAGGGLTDAMFAGRLFARAIIDQHILNLPISPALQHVLRGDTMVLDDVRHVSPAVYRTLLAILKAKAKGDVSYVEFGSGGDKTAVVPLTDLGLTFVVPDRDGAIELVPNGATIEVTPTNVEDYVTKVAATMLCDGVRRASVEMREAFNEVLSVKSLRLFSVSELDGLFSGHQQPVTTEEWAQYCTCDHGFTQQHPTVRMLFEELGSWTLHEQNAFIQFLTGAPQLPVGGLAALRPRVTIVRKKLISSDGNAGNLAEEVAQLPSAMTCQNFLKLPAYETRHMLAEKLKQAVNYGGGAFHFT